MTLRKDEEKVRYLMITKVKCRHCEELISREEAIQYKDEYLCESCFDEYYAVCSDCGTIIEVSDAVTVDIGRHGEKLVCDNCADNYSVCSSCGDYISSDEIWASDHDLTICMRCSEHYYICEDCDAILTENSAIYCSHDDRYYCQSCFEEHSFAYIEEYSYKPEPIFLGSSDDNLYLGIELEVDRGKNLYSATRQITQNFEYVYLKHDGSLSHIGFEIVSHPATLDYHINEFGWDEIMDICTDNGYRSHDTSTCGLHIHMSREFLGNNETERDLNIAKLIILFDRWWDKYIVPFSRRNIDTIARWADKPSLECLNTDTESEIVDKVKCYKTRGRYKAINLENEDTIEFRLFRGTLKLNTFIASLQFVVSITQFAKTVRLNDIFTAKWSDVFLHTEYSELKEYLTSKNLLKGEN